MGSAKNVHELAKLFEKQGLQPVPASSEKPQLFNVAPHGTSPKPSPPPVAAKPKELSSLKLSTNMSINTSPVTPMGRQIEKQIVRQIEKSPVSPVRAMTPQLMSAKRSSLHANPFESGDEVNPFESECSDLESPTIINQRNTNMSNKSEGPRVRPTIPKKIPIGNHVNHVNSVDKPSMRPVTTNSPTKTSIDKSSKRYKIIYELLQTEATYLKDLKLLISHYREPMGESGYFTQNEMKKLFFGLDLIVEFSGLFYDCLKEAENQDSIGKVFLDLVEPMEEAYLPYCTNIESASAQVTKIHSNEAVEIQDFLKVCCTLCSIH